MVGERCPLLFNDSFIYEEDIPLECKNCLSIGLDSDPGSDGYPSIFRSNAGLDLKNSIGSRDCKHGSYYWITGVVRGETSERLIEISAACDECDNFVLNRYIAVCKVES